MLSTQSEATFAVPFPLPLIRPPAYPHVRVSAIQAAERIQAAGRFASVEALTPLKVDPLFFSRRIDGCERSDSNSSIEQPNRIGQGRLPARD